MGLNSDLRHVASTFFPELLSISRPRTEPRWPLLAVLVEHLHKFIVFDDEDDRGEGKVIDCFRPFAGFS